MKWIDVKDRLPSHKETGGYMVKTNNGKSMAFYTRRGFGKYDWLCINEDYIVTHWMKPEDSNV